MKTVEITNPLVKKMSSELLTKGNNSDDYYIGIIEGLECTLKYLKHAVEEGMISEHDIMAFLDDSINDVEKL